MSKKNVGFRVVGDLVKRYFDHGVGRKGAELAYYLLFALLPSLIYINALLEAMSVDLMRLIDEAQFVPQDVRSILRTYLGYIDGRQDTWLVAAGVAFSVYSASLAMNSLSLAVDRAYGTVSKRRGIAYFAVSALLAVILLANVVISLVLLVSGGWLITTAGEYIPNVYDMSGILRILGFLAAFLCGLVSLTIIYASSHSRSVRVHLRDVLPGAMGAEVAWLIVSGAFSYYVSNLGRYSIMYGSLGAIMVLMLWLFLTSVIIVLGGELNAVLVKNRTARKGDITDCK